MFKLALNLARRDVPHLIGVVVLTALGNLLITLTLPKLPLIAGLAALLLLFCLAAATGSALRRFAPHLAHLHAQGLGLPACGTLLALPYLLAALAGAGLGLAGSALADPTVLRQFAADFLPEGVNLPLTSFTVATVLTVTVIVVAVCVPTYIISRRFIRRLAHL